MLVTKIQEEEIQAHISTVITSSSNILNLHTMNPKCNKPNLKLKSKFERQKKINVELYYNISHCVMCKNTE